MTQACPNQLFRINIETPPSRLSSLAQRGICGVPSSVRKRASSQLSSWVSLAEKCPSCSDRSPLESIPGLHDSGCHNSRKEWGLFWNEKEITQDQTAPSAFRCCNGGFVRRG